MKSNIALEKSYKFAIRIVGLYKFLIEKKEFVMSKQILRSGTSIGANLEEAAGGQSANDFISKLSIAYKESRETKFWINLLRDCDYIDNNSADLLLNDCEELCRIIGSSQITAKKNKN